MTYNVYIASNLRHYQKWLNLPSDSLSGCLLVSTWPRVVELVGILGDSDPKITRRAWIMNIEDISDCDFLVVYGEDGEKLRGALVECGVALAMKKPIVLCGDANWGTWINHPGVVPGASPTIEDATRCGKEYVEFLLCL